MAVTETETIEWGYNYPLSTWKKLCAPWQYTGHRDVWLSRVKYSTRDVDSRTKPDESNLIWSPTPQERVYTYREGAAVVEFPRAISYDFACGSPYTNYPYEVWDHHYPRVWDNWVSGPEQDFPDHILPLRLKIKDETINLGAAVAEYRQSVRMFGSAARGIRDAWRSIRKLKFAKKRSMCSITNAHLIHDYGIAPLLSDVFDSVEALRLRLEHPVYRRFYVSRKNETRWEYSGPSQSTWYDLYGQAVRRKSIKATAYVEYDMQKASLFTLGNPAEILWEITPFSFVVDWMIPVGDWLISLDAMKAVKRVAGVVSKKEKLNINTTFEGTDINGNTFRSNPDGYFQSEFHEREVFNSLPIPPLPKLDVRGSISTLLNATSLLVSVRGCKGVMPRYKSRDF